MRGHLLDPLLKPSHYQFNLSTSLFAFTFRRIVGHRRADATGRAHQRRGQLPYIPEISRFFKINKKILRFTKDGMDVTLPKPS